MYCNADYQEMNFVDHRLLTYDCMYKNQENFVDTGFATDEISVQCGDSRFHHRDFSESVFLLAVLIHPIRD